MDRAPGSDPPDATPTQPLAQDQALVVTLRSGERIVAQVGADQQTAGARLRDLQRELAEERFVRVGDELVLRAEEVHAVELVQEQELSRIEARGPGARQRATHAPVYATDDDLYRAWAGPAGGRRRATPVDRIEWTLAERVGLVPSAELVATLAGIAGVLVAALVTDDLDAAGAWLVVGLLVAAYVVSRGISKAGGHSP